MWYNHMIKSRSILLSYEGWRNRPVVEVGPQFQAYGTWGLAARYAHLGACLPCGHNHMGSLIALGLDPLFWSGSSIFRRPDHLHGLSDSCLHYSLAGSNISISIRLLVLEYFMFMYIKIQCLCILRFKFMIIYNNIL